MHWGQIFSHVGAGLAAAGTALWVHRKQVAKGLLILLQQNPPADQGPALKSAARLLGAEALPAAKVLLETVSK